MPQKRKLIPQTRAFPFPLVNLTEADMEILNGTEIWDHLSIQDHCEEEAQGVLICSASDDEVGAGNLLVIPFDEVIELGRGDATGGDLDMDNLYVVTKTTEGEQVTYIYDFRII